MSQAILFDEVTAMSAATRPKLSNALPKEQVLAAAMDYFKNDELAATTWMNKYALRNSKGELTELDPADTHRRMAREFARIERSYGPLTPEKQASNFSTASATSCRKAVSWLPWGMIRDLLRSAIAL